MGPISTGGTCFNKMNRFEEQNFKVGYWTNNSPINLGGFWDEDYKFEEESFKDCYNYRTNNSPQINPGHFWDENLMPQDHFWTEVPFGYSGQNFNITANEDLMPQGHPWTEAPFGYPSQNLEILDTTANEDINV